MIDNYSFLIKKLDEFIRKFYFNSFLKGILYSVAIILIFFLFITLAEYFFFFTSFIRKILFFSFIIISLTSIVFLVFIPLLKIYKLGNIISHHQAAEIIGKHFNNIEDKLINILQLKNASISLNDASLIEASINQKAIELKPIPFSAAINLKDNRKYFKYALPPLFLFIFLILFQPNIIQDSTTRLVNNNQTFEKPAPFTFVIQNNNLTAVQFEDFKVDIKVVGNEIPNEIYLVTNNIHNVTQKLNSNNFSYVFSNLQKGTSFYLEAAGFKSKQYFIDVKSKPLISNFQLLITYPPYLGLKDASFANTGDLSVPEGSKIRWIFDAQATDKISMQFSDTLLSQNNDGNNTFIFDKVLKNNEKYKVKIFNNELKSIDSSSFNISVINDAFPQIEVEEYIDSTNNDVYFYIGKIIDDYGLSALNFNYSILKSDGSKISKKISIPFSRGTISDFTYYWNIKEKNILPGDKVSYYFEVFDNDKINGSKSTKSKWMTFEIPSLDELENNSEDELSEIKNELEKSIEKSIELQNDLKELQENIFQKKELTWENKKELEKLLAEQKKLQNKVESLENKLDNNIEKQSEFKEVNPEIKKKQELVQKLFDEVLDDKMKSMIDKLEKLMDEMNKEDALEKMEEMQVSDEDLENELDRMLELLKKLEFEQKMQESIDKLNKLAKKQEDLSNESKNKKSNTEDIAKEQDKINDDFEKLKEDLDDLQENNEDTDLSDEQEKAEDINEDLKNSEENISKGKMDKASDNQKDASEKMKEMAQSLSNMIQSMQMASMEEDMESLRQLLENLVILSLEQESLLYLFNKTVINTPKYVELVQEQSKLIDDSKLVEDSLFALSKRVFELESFITDEIQNINRNLDKAVNFLEERKVNFAIVNQQYVMTGFNNLALMLSEVMSQMQQQMAQQMQGNQMCENPGNKPGKKPGKIPSLKQMQQQLNDQINEMSEMMKEGSSSGSKEGQSKKLAEMAAKQQAIRQALEEINKSENKDGKGSLGNLQKIIEEMNQNETDIVNKQLTNELLERQQDILTRLLEAENAEKERDEKEERKSITAKQYINKIPPSLEDYINKQEGSISFYRNIPPKLKLFYKNISENYINNVFE